MRDLVGMVRMRGHCEHLCVTFEAAMDVLARPWNGFILATLESGPLRFSELAHRVTGIGDRMLSLRLKELEAAAVISRVVYPGAPARVEYRLTEAGAGFRAVQEAIGSWGRVLIEARSALAERVDP